MNTAMMRRPACRRGPSRRRRRSTSPSCISNIGTSPPSGVKESCIELTEPFEAAVVASPRAPSWRCRSAPPCPPCCRRPARRSQPAPRRAGRRPGCRPARRRRRRRAAARRSVIAASTAQPWRVSPTILPKVKQSAAGISRIASTSRKFDSGVGFSNGCAELTLKKPPPLVPSCLIAICEAAGPTASACSVTALPSASAVASRSGTLRRARASAPRPARPGPAPARATAAAGCRAWCASGRPRSCRSSRPSAARSRG